MHLFKRSHEEGSVILQIWKAITIAILLIQLTGCASLQWEKIDINQVIENIDAQKGVTDGYEKDAGCTAAGYLH